MKRPSWTAAAVVTALAAIPACGGSSPPPSTSGPAGGGERISGGERLGWTQSAADATELASFRYAAYVDNNRVELAAATCGASGGAFSCSSPMPPMNAGAHSIELVSFVVDNGVVIESARSAALHVTVTGLTADAAPPMANATSTRLLTTTSDFISGMAYNP